MNQPRKRSGVSLLGGLAIALAALSVTPAARANVYATNIKINGSLTSASGTAGSPVSISYILNEAATAGVTVKILQGNTVVATIPGGATRGLNTVSWTPSSGGAFSVSITAAATGFTTWTQTSIDTNSGMQANFPLGIAVDNNTNSPYYGRVVMGNATVGSNPNIAAAAKKVGFYKMNADGTQADEGWYGNANYLADDGGDTAVAGQMPNSGGFDPMKIRIGEDDRIYWVDNSDFGAIVSTDILATTNQVVICEGGPGFPGGGHDVGPNYSQNPDVSDVEAASGFQVFDVAFTTTTNASLWIGDNDFPNWGVQMYHMTNGIVDTNDTLGSQAVFAGTGSDVSLVTSGGLMVDYNLDIFVSQSRFNNNPVFRTIAYTNWNAGILPPPNQSSALAETTPSAWAIGTSDPTLCSIQDTVINSRTAPTMVALPMSTGAAGTFSAGISVHNTSDGSVVTVTNGLGAVIQSLTNLDYPQIYRCAAWDNVGNLYGGSTTLNVWRVFSPPGANTNTTKAVATVNVAAPVTITITSITVSGTTVTVNFTGSASDPASAFTLMSSAAAIPASGYVADGGAVITLVSPGVFKAVTTTSGSARFYRIKR